MPSLGAPGATQPGCPCHFAPPLSLPVGLGWEDEGCRRQMPGSATCLSGQASRGHGADGLTARGRRPGAKMGRTWTALARATLLMNRGRLGCHPARGGPLGTVGALLPMGGDANGEGDGGCRSTGGRRFQALRKARKAWKARRECRPAACSRLPRRPSTLEWASAWAYARCAPPPINGCRAQPPISCPV